MRAALAVALLDLAALAGGMASYDDEVASVR
jgi:hypothetical protein